MPEYTCVKCNKLFNQKGDYTKHMNRKLPCDGTNVIEKIKSLEEKTAKIEKMLGQYNNTMAEQNEQVVVEPEEKDEIVDAGQTSVQPIVPLTKLIHSKLSRSKLMSLYAVFGKTFKSKINRVNMTTYIHSEINNITTEQDRQIRLLIVGDTVANIPKPARKKAVIAVAQPEEKKESEEFVFDEKITSSDGLRDKIHSIHDFLRNTGIGYGMSALKIFSLLYGLRKIEHNITFDKINLNEQCKYSELVKLAKLNDKQCLTLFKKDYMKYIIKSKLKRYLLVKIPDHIKSKDFNYLILEIDLLANAESSMNMNLSGKIYEYFIGRDETAIAELGAYFTNRLITDYIYNLVKPKLADDKVQSMIDPFGGSGGFTLGYINYLMKNNDVDWKENLENVNHIDMNNDVVKYAGLECMCMTGEIPTMGTYLRCENSFTFEFQEQFKYIFTNPPYGGDKNRRYGTRLKNWDILTYVKELVKPINTKIYNNKFKDIKKHVKILNEELEEKQILDAQISHCTSNEKYYAKKFNKTKVSLENSSSFIRKYAHNNGLTGNDKESVSFILIMALLAPGGTAVGVLKEGVFFASAYQKLRAHLIMHFNILKVISVPQDQFENTSTKTSIIIFKNPINKQEGVPQTTNIEFRKLNVLKYESNKFVFNDETKFYELSQESDGIFGMEDPIIANASFKELKKKHWCLDGKKYNVKVLKPGKGFKMIKLGDIAKFNSSNEKSTKQIIMLVKIKDISNNEISSYENIENKNVKTSQICTDGDIVISTVRPKSEKVVLLKNIKNINEYAFTHLGKIVIDNKKLNNPYYIFAIITKFAQTFEETLCNGSSYPRFNISQLANIQIPIPENPKVMQYWVDRISTPHNLKHERKVQLKQLEDEVSNEVKRITEEEDCDEHKLGDIVKINPIRKIKTKDILYADISSIVNNKISSTVKYNINKAPSRAKRLTKKNDIIYSMVRPKQKNNAIVHVDDIVVSTGFAVINCINKCHIIYIYTLLNSDDMVNKLSNLAYGSNYPSINSNILNMLSIKLPKNKKLITDLESKFQLIEQYKQDIKNANEQFKKLIDELSKKTIQ
jgi:restriction endonuclease S subunit/uncharacterized C2H2 Zn-finger protein